MIFNMTGDGSGGSKRFPDFEYTGQVAPIIDDGKVDGVQNWRLKFLTSGTLTFHKEPGLIDVFLVGGGGSASKHNSGNGGGNGGGGGFTTTVRSVSPEKDVPYTIVIGAGGAENSGTAKLDGGETSAFEAVALGGSGGNLTKAGPGGSGGGGGYGNDGAGGSDGSDGGGGTVGGTYGGGEGQHTTTREFAEATGDLYAGGGGGSNSGQGGAGGGGNSGVGGETNTGGGGGGGTSVGGAGGSGIVVIRNHREVSA